MPLKTIPMMMAMITVARPNINSAFISQHSLS